MKIVHITASSNMLLTNYMDNYLFLFFTKCAQNETRTHTPEPALPPQSSVSTNFTTWALLSRINFRECKYRHYFAIRKIFAEKTTKFAWGPPGSFCGGPGMLYLSVISLSR